MLESERSGDEFPMVLVELLIGLELFRNEDLQQVVDELSFQKFDGLELQQVVQEEGLGVGQRRDDAALGFLSGLARILSRVCPQEFDHHLQNAMVPLFYIFTNLRMTRCIDYFFNIWTWAAVKINPKG